MRNFTFLVFCMWATCTITAVLLAALLFVTAVRREPPFKPSVYMVGMVVGAMVSTGFVLTTYLVGRNWAGMGFEKIALAIPAVALIEAGLVGMVGLSSWWRAAPALLVLGGARLLAWLLWPRRIDL